MNFLIKVILIFFLLSFIEAQHFIGNYSTVFQDSNRSNRNISTEIYYPATLQGENAPASIGQFPIIIFGHGSAIPWDAYQNLWEEFVTRGYIMAFPTTEEGLISNHQQFGWDIQFLVTKIQDEGNRSNSPIFNIVDNNTALMGHSMGGGAIFLAGDSLCSDQNNQLKTIIGLAPAESFSNGVSSITSAAGITVPALILSGSQDGVTPANDHHLPIYYNLTSNYKTFISILGGAHCYFGNSNLTCDLLELLSSSGISITREQQQQVSFEFLNSWLDYTLKDNCDAYLTFQDSTVSSNRITHNQVHEQNPIPSIFEDEGTLISSITGIGYQWFLNDDIIPEENNIALTPFISGEYSVKVFFPNGCPTVSNSHSFNFELASYIDIFPSSYIVYQNYPNPFNPITTLRYSIPKNEFVNITIYDMIGTLVKTLVNGPKTAGNNSVQWDATNDNKEQIAAGLYIFTIQSGNFRQSKKMVLLK